MEILHHSTGIVFAILVMAWIVGLCLLLISRKTGRRYLLFGAISAVCAILSLIHQVHLATIFYTLTTLASLVAATKVKDRLISPTIAKLFIGSFMILPSVLAISTIPSTGIVVAIAATILALSLFGFLINPLGREYLRNL